MGEGGGRGGLKFHPNKPKLGPKLIFLLIEIKPAKKNWGPKFVPNRQKFSPKLGFSSFSQVCFISFPSNYIG